MPIQYILSTGITPAPYKIIAYVVGVVRWMISETESLHCPELEVGLYSTVMIRKITESLKSYSQITRRNKDHNASYVGGTYL